MGRTNRGLAATALGNTLTRSGPEIYVSSTPNSIIRIFLYSHAAVEVHSVDTNRRVVLDAEINVFADTEAEVASLREVALAELIFLNLQSTLQDFFSLWSTDGDVNRDLFVTTDTEGSDGVASLAWEEIMSVSIHSV